MKHIINLAGDCSMPKNVNGNDCKIEKHVGDGTFELDPSRLQLHFSPNQIDGKCIEGNKLREELEKNKVPVLNACVLDYLLLHPELIPENWKKNEKGNTLFIDFWGTVYRYADGSLYIRSLYFSGSVWLWHCYKLDLSWTDDSSSAMLASVPQS